METLTTNNQSDTTRQATVLAAESCHWYAKDGTPCYEVPKAKGDGMRPATLADARKLDLVPSVTTILQCAAKPGLEAWKAKQLLEAALTLPQREGESLDDYATRVIEDSKAQGLKARDRGTALHEAIECFIQGKTFDHSFGRHIARIEETLLQQCGLNLVPADAEKTFATSSFGGKIDWKQGVAIADFKTKDRIELKKKLAYDEHIIQLAAYANGSGANLIGNARCLSIFVGVEDANVVIYEWTSEDIARGLKMFDALLTFWQLSKNWNSTHNHEHASLS